MKTAKSDGARTERTSPPYSQTKESLALAREYQSRLNTRTKGLYEEVTRKGHPSKHAGLTQVQVMNDLLETTLRPEKNMPRSSNSFRDEESLRADCIDALNRASYEIAAWRAGCHNSHYSYDTLVLYMEMYGPNDPGQPATKSGREILPGTAFLQKSDDISASHNTNIKLVLNPDYENPRSFVLTTAHPLTDPEFLPDRENDTVDIIRQTETYKNATPLQKAVFEYKGKLKPDDRPYAKMSEKYDSFIISCQKDLRKNEPGAGLGAVFIVYEDGSIKYRGDRSSSRVPVVDVTPQKALMYAALYPDQMKIAAEMSARIKELSPELPAPEKTKESERQAQSNGKKNKDRKKAPSGKKRCKSNPYDRRATRAELTDMMDESLDYSSYGQAEDDTPWNRK